MRAFLLALAFSSASIAFAGNPFSIQHADHLTKTNESSVLFRDGDALLTRNPHAKSADFSDLYVVRTPEWFSIPDAIHRRGEVLSFVPTKFAVMKIAPKDIETVSGLLHQGGLACGGVFRLYGDAIEMQAAATPTPLLPVNTRDAFVLQVAEQAAADRIRTSIEELSSITTRHHSSTTGREVAQMLVDKYLAMANGRTDVTAEVYDHGSATGQNSLRVRIQGQSRPDEVIILGSHIDSINWMEGSRSRSPGADDNASGTATNIEIFRLLMENGIQLERTLEIHGYAAEEIGLVGSQNMAKAYKDAGVNVVAMVQHDMNLYKPQGSPDKIWFVTSNTHDPFNDMLAQLVDHYAGVPWEKKSLFGGDSDHTSWTRRGYAAAFPFENPGSYNRHIHTRDDTTANANAFNQAAAFAKLGVAYVAHFGGVAP